MDDFWLIALIFLGICLSTWVFHQLFYAPTERANEKSARECLDRQAARARRNRVGYGADHPLQDCQY